MSMEAFSVRLDADPETKYQDPVTFDQVPPGSSLAFLKRAQHAFRASCDEALRPLGLTAPRYVMLAAVSADEGISNAQLDRLAFVTPQTMQAPADA